MNPSSSRYRWTVVIIFFFFMLLHQSDKLLIGPLTTNIIADFGITNTQMGAVFSVALIVGSVLYPVWGYLYDQYARAKLVSLASFIWGLTTWVSAVAPTYGLFLTSRASTGIDDSSYPGLYSLISDYFGPSVRGKIYGALQVAQPLGYLVGLILALVLGPVIGWRRIFFITGSLGLVLAVLIFFGVREMPRGKAEPELAGLEEIGMYRFDREKAIGLFRKRSLWLLFAQGFVGVFPWNVITFWFFAYLETERGYDEQAILVTMAPAVLVLASGYFVGGSLGDFFFKRTPRGRLLVSMGAVLAGAVLLTLTLNVPVENQTLFFILLCLTALFIPFASPNVISSVYDITLPEVRSSALAVQYFIENGGAAIAPLLAGYIADRASLHVSILSICVVAWILGSIILAFAAYRIPEDIHTLRGQMAERAELEKGRQALEGS
ncbi:MAG TPA: MFS transporter [Anaerolineales bacterium]|nr:MFS transporter [Anaerolineales bacterium]